MNKNGTEDNKLTQDPIFWRKLRGICVVIAIIAMISVIYSTVGTFFLLLLLLGIWGYPVGEIIGFICELSVFWVPCLLLSIFAGIMAKAARTKYRELTSCPAIHEPDGPVPASYDIFEKGYVKEKMSRIKTQSGEDIPDTRNAGLTPEDIKHEHI